MSDIKMSEVFVDVIQLGDTLIGYGHGKFADFSGLETEARYAAHAINNHDRMAEEIAELKGALNTQLSVLKGYKDLMIHPLSLDDDIANIEQILAKLNQEGGE